MKPEVYNIESISQLHTMMGLPAPSHPLISLINANELVVPEEALGVQFLYGFYMISMKDKSCGVQYGRNTMDFDEGVMTFSAPKQSYIPHYTIEKGEIDGWLLYVHPDLIRNTTLGSHMDEYTFFNYEVFEALHLSKEEEDMVNACIRNIENEYTQRIDNHSQRVIVSNLELLLNYCLRYYERQFNTRTSKSKDVISDFEKALSNYFNSTILQEEGLPSINRFAEDANLSKHYFSDLVKKETGRSPKDHINDFVIEKAKNSLVNTEQSVNEIAYSLGFNYPHYFTRLFKSKTGHTPVEYRSLN